MMVAPYKIPMTALLGHFETSLEGIVRIKDTFRTPTGKEYGPDFIARGLLIGEKLYEELAEVYMQEEGGMQGIDLDRPGGQK